MNKALIIIFVKNIKLGTVKTRLAKTIGDQGAFEVYKALVKITETVTSGMATDKRIYFSDAVIDSKWHDCYKTVQNGNDLGERMKDAFSTGFKDGYNRIVLIGSDLPDLRAEHIENGLNLLKDNDAVFGPALDGGYYLVGLSKMHDFIFDNKPWSESHLLEVTLSELHKNNITYKLLEPLNDIDTFEDLEHSEFYKSDIKLKQRIQQLHD